MRQTILALTAALAVLPALCFASAPPDTLPESYPAVGWQEITPAELFELRRAVFGSGNLDSIQAIWAKTQPESLPPNAWYEYSWLRVQLPDADGQALRDVQFFRQTGGLWQSWPRVEALALYNGRLYELRSLNKLFADCGFRFDTSDVKTVAKIAVLWTLMQRQAKLHQPPGDDFGQRSGPGPDSAALATAIPAVTFKKIGWGQWQHPTHHEFTRRAVRIDLLVDGMARTAWMMPGIGDLVPMWLNLDGQVSTFYQGSEIKQPAEAQPAPQK